MQIITDSSCDLPKEVLDKNNIIVIPLNIEIDGKNYIDGVDLTHEQFYKKMSISKTLPKTSQPSPQNFIDAFKETAKKTKEILCIHLSSKLSGTTNCAIMAKEMVNKKIEIFDSLSGSVGLGMQVLKACEMVRQGVSLERIVEKLKEYRDNMRIIVYLETLENAIKSGRVTRAKGAVANLLNLKAILHVEKGYVKILKTIRGKKRAIKFMLNEMKGKNVDFRDKVIRIAHCNCIEDALALKEEIIKHFNPVQVLITTMGPVIGTHAGQGGLVVCF